MKPMKPILVAMLLLAGFIASASDLLSLEQWASTIWAKPLPRPKDSTYVILVREGPGKFSKTLAKATYAPNPDGSYSQDYKGADESSRSVFLPNGSLASSTTESVVEQKTYRVSIGPDRRQVSFLTEAMGKKPVSKSVSIKKNAIVMDLEYVNLIRQAWQNGLRGGAAFKFKGLPPDGSMEIDMETRLIETDAPCTVSEAYEIPIEFKAAFPDSGQYVVADFSLGGMFSLMYKYHIYWIFRVTPTGLDFAGSFGGNPKTADYKYISE